VKRLATGGFVAHRGAPADPVRARGV